MVDQKFVLGVNHSLSGVQTANQLIALMGWINKNVSPGSTIALELAQPEIDKIRTSYKNLTARKVASYKNYRFTVALYYKELIDFLDQRGMKVVAVDYWPAKRRALAIDAKLVKKAMLEKKKSGKYEREPASTYMKYLINPIRENKMLEKFNASEARFLICGAAHARSLARRIGASTKIFIDVKTFREHQSWLKNIPSRKSYKQRKQRRIARQRRLGIVK
ncbi:MAG: hypothetical protein Q7K42_03635 [Candidatus Diapherotrites archaeon]|nr:hypothetical protein [Candidatus Diapherotrites archaeon]